MRATLPQGDPSKVRWRPADVHDAALDDTMTKTTRLVSTIQLVERWDDAAVTDIIRRPGRDVGMPAADADYVDRVLTDAPVNLLGLPPQVVAQGIQGR